METLPVISDEKLVGDNPREKLAARLQSLRMIKIAKEQQIKELKRKAQEEERESETAEILEKYKITYIEIFNRLVEKYLGFTLIQILAGETDIKTIEALEEVIAARAKRNLIIGLAAAALIPIIGWAVILVSSLENLSCDQYSIHQGVINLPMIFFRLKKEFKRRGINPSSIIAEKYSWRDMPLPQ